MNKTAGICESILMTNEEYEPPVLIVIGDASDVVLGYSTGGFDCCFQMTEPAFEFELDDDSPQMLSQG